MTRRRRLTLTVNTDPTYPELTTFVWDRFTGEVWQMFGVGAGGTPLGHLTSEKISDRVARMVGVAKANGYHVNVVRSNPRRNPGDEDLRRLERLAAQGDPAAEEALERARERRRRCLHAGRGTDYYAQHDVGMTGLPCNAECPQWAAFNRMPPDVQGVLQAAYAASGHGEDEEPGAIYTNYYGPRDPDPPYGPRVGQWVIGDNYDRACYLALVRTDDGRWFTRAPWSDNDVAIEGDPREVATRVWAKHKWRFLPLKQRGNPMSNPRGDEERRRLERLARQGDPAAMAALDAANRRAGMNTNLLEVSLLDAMLGAAGLIDAELTDDVEALWAAVLEAYSVGSMAQAHGWAEGHAVLPGQPTARTYPPVALLSVIVRASDRGNVVHVGFGHVSGTLDPVAGAWFGVTHSVTTSTQELAILGNRISARRRRHG